MSQYLLDTSVVSLSVWPSPPAKLLTKLLHITPASAIASVTVSELRFGALRVQPGRHHERLMHFVDRIVREDFDVLSFDAAAAEWHAVERARLGGLGRTPPFADGQIAAVAAVNNLTLITLNPRDFEQFEGVHVEGWNSRSGR